ncbi:MAG: DUF5060 domain-containing protein [bacterium]|nr:DUF5060 domain-containing protein [bacterium]
MYNPSRLVLFLLLFAIFISSIYAAPSITSVSLNTASIGTYEKLELTVGLTAAYANPFDPGQVDLKSVFVSPSLSQFTVCGFWNGSQWKLRFAANTTGVWNYTIYLSDSTGGSTSTTGSFTVFNSGHHGWVRVSNDNPRYFEYDDDTPYFGLGHSRPWDIEQAVNIYSNMSTNGMNVLVYWMPSWDNMLPTMWYTTTGYDRYDMQHANAIDQVVENCEKYNIQLMLSIWDHGELRDASHAWSGSGGYWWQYNPFQLIPVTPQTFFTNSTSWYYQTNLYRYIIARWSSSRALGWWQTVVEIDGTMAYGNASTWHYKINDYFQKNDPFRHPTYASKNIDESNWWPEGFGWMDVVNGHCYYSRGANDTTRVSNAIAYWTRRFWNNYTKPNVISEFGIVDTWKNQPDHIHNGNWAGVCAGAACGPLDWNDGSTFGDMTMPMFATMKVLRAFVSDIPFSKMNLQPATISVNTANIAVYGMVDTTFCYFWVQDSTPGETITNLPVTVNGLNNGTYRVYWWDTWSGVTVLAKTEYVVGGTVTILAPSFKKDIAAKMYRVTDVLSSSTAFWDFDTSDEGWSSGGSYGSATVLSGPIQVETPTHPVTNNGSIYYTFNLTPTGSWSDIKGRATDLGGLNWANYNTITAFIYLPAGAPTLQAKLYTETGTNTTWQEPVAATTVSAGTWTALVLSKSDIADPTKVYTFGFKLGHATNNYTNGTVYFDYVNGYGYSYPSNPMSLSVVGSTSLLIGETTDLNASGGYKPYTWSIITTWTYTGSSPGYLDSYSNPTVTFTATAIGTCYISVTDAVGQTQNSALLGVSPLPVSVTLYGSPIVSVGKTRQLSAANGYAPYTWAIITTAGSPGYLNAYTGSNITFNATGIGTCYISVIDNYSNTQNSPNISVTATNAPIFPSEIEFTSPWVSHIDELFE